VPLSLLIIFIIKRKSAGPVLFQQKRLGYKGEPFMCLKFRTMHCGAETVSHQGHLQQLITSNAPMTKLDNSGDSRIIRFGKILRASGLDELPQLINILKGEMSLVGPRPLQVRDYELFETYCGDWQRKRFSVRPGITCLWQIKGRSSTTFERWMELDLQYIRTWSVWLDLEILAKTVPAVLKGSGAA